jgi:O-antigen/teichoic acid export membrane protein
MSSDQNVATLVAPRVGLRHRLFARGDQRSLVLNGSLIMLLGTAVVSISNFTYNVAMARMLGPAEFGHVTAAATLLMIFSAVGLSFQLVCAKFIARNESGQTRREVYRGLSRRAWLFGSAIGVALLIVSHRLAELLRLPSALLIVVMAVAIALSVPLGAKRGGLQGLCEFPRLSGNFVSEALTKLLIGLLLVSAGYGIYGAVGAISASVIAAMLLFPVRFAPSAAQCELVPASFYEGMQAIAFFSGHVLISNIDILLVKSFFPPAEAGIYAAVALLGRLLYYASWSIISAMFPVSAAAGEEEPPPHMLRTPLLLVAGLSVLFIATVTLVPRFLISMVLGSQFAEAGDLLGYYAIATAIYSLSVVLITYEMSRKIANTGWLQLLIGGLTVLGISLFHGSLREVIAVQITLMSVLLVSVSLPFLRNLLRQRRQPEVAVR